MAIDVSTINNIIIERLDPIIQMIEQDSLLRVLRGEIEEHEGPCPATYRATYLIPDVTITGCCEPYNGGGTTKQKDFSVECWKAGDDYCETDLAKLYRGAGRKVKYTAGAEDAGAAGEYVARANWLAFIDQFNRQILLGDKTSSDPKMNHFDGWITQALRPNDTTPGTGATEVTIASGNLWEAYVQIYLLLAANPQYRIYGRELLLFVPEVFAELYNLLILANRLVYPDASTTGVLGLPNITVVPVNALDTLDDDGNYTIFLVPAKNLVAIVSDRDDEYVYDWDYIKDRDGEYYLWRIKGCLGLGVYDERFAVVAHIAPSVASNVGSTINVNILNESLTVATNPAGANGGLLTDTTA